jgi:hypothetical protein
VINTTINKAAADLSKTASIFYDRAIFLADTVQSRSQLHRSIHWRHSGGIKDTP